MRFRLTPLLMVVAGLVFLLATTGMLAGREPFATWYYSFAWWSYIVFVDAWLARRSPPGIVLGNPDAARLIGLSVTIWVSFEVYNFRLRNWYYLNIPPGVAERWTGYMVAYATVLPGILVTWKLLQILIPPRSTKGKLFPQYLPPVLLWGGLVSSLVPWIWPRYLFPLVWLGPTAFFAAINYRLGGEGILREVENRGWSRFYLLLGAGAICGFLWELWNFWARSKWVYSIPFFDWLHLFEMPMAGFLGFLPFALECHEMYCVARKVLDRTKRRPALRWALWLCIAGFIVITFWGIDHFTVRTFQQ